jgi:hypothetical protein
MISSMLVFARNCLGTLLREATRGAPLPSAKRRLFRRVWKMFFAFFAQKIFWKPKPVGHRLRHNKLSVFEEQCAAVGEAETRRAAGRGNSTERVTEGEQGKNWRNGARTEISANWDDCSGRTSGNHQPANLLSRCHPKLQATSACNVRTRTRIPFAACPAIGPDTGD